MRHPSRRLALVVDRPVLERDSDGGEPASNGGNRLEEIIQQRGPLGAAIQTTSFALGAKQSPEILPFAMHLTMVQILEVAEDTEIRAEILDDVTSTLDAGRDQMFSRQAFSPGIARLDPVQQRIDSLRDVASELRLVAARMVDRWVRAERPS